MAQNYARSFYAGKRWKRTQAAYMASQHYICERCGGAARVVHHKKYITPGNIDDPMITLDWDNLEAVCQDCHASAHSGGTCAEGLRFDQDGNIVKV